MDVSLVSIIIPTYNRAHLIKETLDSVAAQTYQNWECIIVDDGSTDDTENIVKDYIKQDSRFQFHSRPSNRSKGGNAARNYGYEISKGEFINWFDSDDIMEPTKIELQLNGLIGSNFDFSVCQTMVFEENIENVIGIRQENLYAAKPFESYITGDLVWLILAPIWRKNFLDKMDSLFDETLKASQEWEFFSRVLFKYNKEYDIINKPLVFARKHTNSISHGNDIHVKRAHYITARKKLYSFVKNNNPSKETIIYFGAYFISKYKNYLKYKNYKAALNLLLDPLLGFKYFKTIFKLKLIFGMVLFVIFGKGESAFSGQKYKFDNE
jgi:glycosyltransferase involved in cell wall biosynthesis